MKKGYLSFDAETNGLWGEAFSIGAIVTNEKGELIDSFIGRCPINGEVDSFVKENVLPKLEGVEVNYSSYDEMLIDFIKFYMAYKQDKTVLVHMGLPVEAKILLDAHKKGFIGDWDAPYPLVDISAIPEIGTSPDSYNSDNGIEIPECEGETHNPLYDSWSALLSYVHWLSTVEKEED